MKILVTGCLHGEWEKLVNTVNQIEQEKGTKPDLIIVSGDTQTMRTEKDLESLACPPQYRLMHTFYKLYTGEIQMPVPTIVVGGNHEAMDWLFLLPFGGWLAPNVFYAGRANSLVFGDTTISSISGLYRSNFYYQPVNEKYPIRSNDMTSSHHIRAFSDFQLLGLSNTDIMCSHDWPSGTASNYGGKYLEKLKPTLIDSDRAGNFGLIRGMDYINKLTPSAYFAAHHHIKFSTTINDCSFIALPKPAGKNEWCCLVDFEGNPGELKYRGEWISILKATGAEMANPELLKNVNWGEKWKEMKPKLQQYPDQPLGEYELDPIKYTADFCRRNEIFCPNETIRPYI